jgi:hypothetical protein
MGRQRKSTMPKGMGEIREKERKSWETYSELTIISALALSPLNGPSARRCTVSFLRVANPRSVRLYSAATASSSRPQRERMRAMMTPVPVLGVSTHERAFLGGGTKQGGSEWDSGGRQCCRGTYGPFRRCSAPALGMGRLARPDVRGWCGTAYAGGVRPRRRPGWRRTPSRSPVFPPGQHRAR